MKKLEHFLLNIFGQLPNLPPSWREKLAKSAWVVVLILAILSVLFVLFVAALFLYLRYAINNYLLQTAYAHLLLPFFIIGSILNIASILLLITAVSPLKKMQKKGWNLTFYALLLLVAAQILLPLVVTPMYFAFHIVTSYVVLLRLINPLDILRWVIIIAVLFYLLFQAREPFLEGKAKS